MGVFDLPSLWVYIWFANGTSKNVANMDSLTPEEAESIRKMWDRPDRKVVRMTLQTSRGKVYREYKF
jgi:hypothetical protein